MVIYNLNGQVVDTLVIEELVSGEHCKDWHAAELPNGLYLCNLRAGEYKVTKKLVLLR